jgi:acylphosphatase
VDDRSDERRRRVRVRVTGRVQGVFFRATCADLARELGLSGWVRNAPDGSVEGAFEGPAGSVEAIVAWCRRGPSSARVDAVSVSREPPEGTSGFRVAG